MTDPSKLTVLGAHKYVRLTTFRRDGTPVPTPVRLVRAGGTGCLRRRGPGQAGATDVEALAEIISDPAELRRVRDLVKARYGSGYQAMLFQRLRGRSLDNGVALHLRTAP